MENLDIILKVGGVILAILLILWLHVKFNYNKGRETKAQTISNKIERADTVRSVQKSATEIVTTFRAFIELPYEKNKLHRPQRRKIKKFYKEFCYAWYDMPEDKRDVVQMVIFILKYRGNNSKIVETYINTNLKTKEA